jgi:hypothetical protein
MVAWAGVLAFVLLAGCSAPQPTVEPTESTPAAPVHEPQVARTSPTKPMRPTVSASDASPAPRDEPKAAEPAKSAESALSAGRAQPATVSDTAARSNAVPQVAEATKPDIASRTATERARTKQQPPVDRESPAVKPKPAEEEPKKEEPKKESSGCGSAAPEPPWALEEDKSQAEASAGQGQPRWVCDQTTVKAEPVWEGKPVTFVFAFRNEGAAPLRVQAKGG